MEFNSGFKGLKLQHLHNNLVSLFILLLIIAVGSVLM